jgi:Leucine-rich repeat (LRR) protein
MRRVLPESLSALQSLRQLVLSHNYLQALRGRGGEGGLAALCALTGLRCLGLANVSDKRHELQLPPEFSHLAQLTSLDLSLNMLCEQGWQEARCRWIPRLVPGQLIIPAKQSRTKHAHCDP